MELAVRLDDLVDNVERSEGSPLARLAAAVELADSLGVVGDNLIGHFVDEAKAAGASWTSIGSVLGVSKQAAQQRFVPRGATAIDELVASAAVAHYTGRAVHVLRQAAHHARRRKHRLVGTEHLLLGLLDEPEGVGYRTIETLGSTSGEVRQKLRKHLGPGTATEPPVLSGRAEKAVDLALREALRLGHNYVGTEHQLLGLLLVEDDAASTVLHTVGITHESASAQVVRLLAAYRRRQRPAIESPEVDPVLGVVVVEADAFAKAEVASNALRLGRPVLLDLRSADSLLRRRAIDLVSGAAHVLGAAIERIGDGGIIVVPADASLDDAQRQAIDAFLE